MSAALKLPEDLSFVDEARYREEDDHGSGVVFFRPRYYDPRNGRFTRLDPFSGTMASPLTLHKYAYVHGNPVMGVDPTGESWLTVDLLSFTTGRFVIAGAVLGVVAAAWTYVALPWGASPTVTQQVQIDAARAVISRRLVGMSFNLTTESQPFTITQEYADFDKYLVSSGKSFWAKTPPWPRGVIVLNSSTYSAENWFSLTAEEAATILVHELLHRFHVSPGAVEENEGWELTAHAFTALGLPRRGLLWSDIEHQASIRGFPIPSEDLYSGSE